MLSHRPDLSSTPGAHRKLDTVAPICDSSTPMVKQEAETGDADRSPGGNSLQCVAGAIGDLASTRWKEKADARKLSSALHRCVLAGMIDGKMIDIILIVIDIMMIDIIIKALDIIIINIMIGIDIIIMDIMIVINIIIIVRYNNDSNRYNNDRYSDTDRYNNDKLF